MELKKKNTLQHKIQDSSICALSVIIQNTLHKLNIFSLLHGSLKNCFKGQVELKQGVNQKNFAAHSFCSFHCNFRLLLGLVIMLESLNARFHRIFAFIFKALFSFRHCRVVFAINQCQTLPLSLSSYQQRVYCEYLLRLPVSP